ncbi:MAG TPA: glycosyltransferase family 2 protein, partial [Thermoplasmata archaeon]|nr:glycosyltransferase family 2 protein [Thermoplasmata archaeon]
MNGFGRPELLPLNLASHSALASGPAPARRVRIAGGVVAFQDEGRLAGSVRSLLRQNLPPGVEWTDVWVVVSPSTDRTLEVANSLAAEDPRVKVVLEAQRRGKSAALAEVLQRATGDYLVLLNGDARALPGAVSALLRAAPTLPGPFAVMGRPTPMRLDHSPLDSAVELLWDVHHAFHQHLIQNGRSTHLSDELLLIPLAYPPPLS